MGGGLPWGYCPAVPDPACDVVDVGPSDDVAAALANATPGSTIRLADGDYDLSGAAWWIDTPDVTLRGASGDASAGVIDGGGGTPSGGVVNVGSADGVVIANLTIRRARYHAIHVTANDASANGVRVYNVRLIDPGEQALKINHHDNGFYVDDGEVACSYMELTPAGRQQVQSYVSSGSTCYTGGVDAHGARGWTVRDNTIVGFWCDTDLSEHGIHFWTGSRDTLVLRNRLINNARGIGFGLTEGGRTYADDPCGGVTNASHYGGVVRDNFVVGTDPALFASPSGMDLGIGMWHACGATVVHNTVASTEAPFSSIEWRFADTDVLLVNNYATHQLRERDGATAVAAGNMEDAPAAELADVAGFDLHLAEGASAIGAGDSQGVALAPEDIDGDPRSDPPDVGADQR